MIRIAIPTLISHTCLCTCCRDGYIITSNHQIIAIINQSNDQFFMRAPANPEISLTLIFSRITMIAFFLSHRNTWSTTTTTTTTNNNNRFNIMIVIDRPMVRRSRTGGYLFDHRGTDVRSHRHQISNQKSYTITCHPATYQFTALSSAIE